MKLSEILAKPIKLIGGGNINLKGLSKVIVNKEVGDKKINIYNSLKALIQTEFNVNDIFYTDEDLSGDAPSVDFTSDEGVEIGKTIGITDGSYNCAIGICTSSEYYDDDDEYRCTAEIIKKFEVGYGFYLI